MKNDIKALKEQLFLNGFVHIPQFFTVDDIEKIKSRFGPLFAGNFTSGVYPDEWHWREGISKETAFREMVNVWKSDLEISKVVLSERLGKLATDLMDWPGSRVAQDDLLWKPPGTDGVGFHRDSTYISKQFTPLINNSLTIWIALDDCDNTSGVVQYFKASHINYHNTAEEEKTFFQADIQAADMKYDLIAPTVKAGDILCHHQNVLHGSSKNLSASRPRRALGVHLIRSDVKWTNTRKIDYIYGRYKIKGEQIPREDFFPITYLKPKL